MTETTTKTRKPRTRKFSRDQLIADLQALQTEHEGQNIGTKHINRKGSGLPSAQAFITEFGSLNAAKVEAGLAIMGRGKPRRDGGKVDKTGEAALAILKAARVPMTPEQIAQQIQLRGIAPMKAKDKARSVREALARTTATKTDAGYTVA